MVRLIESNGPTTIFAAAGRLRPASGFAWTIAMGGTIAAAAVAYRHRGSWIEALLLTGIALLATALAVVDLHEHRLPNSIVGPLALATTGAVLLAGLSNGDLAKPITAIAAGAGFAALMALGYLARGFRLGDVKYAYPIGVAVGWQGASAFLAMLVALAVAGLLVGLLALARLRSLHARVPYGPVMTAALLVGLLV